MSGLFGKEGANDIMGFLSNYKVSTTKETQNETPTTTTPPILVDMPSKPVNFVFNKTADELEKSEDNDDLVEKNEGSSALEGSSVKETKGGFSFTTPSLSTSGGFSFGGATSSSGGFGFNPGSGSSSSSGFNPGQTSLGAGSMPFSFGALASKTSETTSEQPKETLDSSKGSSTFTFGAIPTSNNTETKPFSFGQVKEAEKPKESIGGFNPGAGQILSFGFNPGAGTSSSSSNTGFNPGNTSLGKSAVPFSFGKLATNNDDDSSSSSDESSEPASVPKPFSLASVTEKEPADNTVSFGFNPAKTQQESTTSSTPFSFNFGQTTTTETTKPVSFNFAKPSEPEKPKESVGGFNPGTGQVLSFGFNPGTGTSSSSSNTGFNPGNTSLGKSAVPFSFGKLATNNDDDSSSSSSDESNPEPPKPVTFSFGNTSNEPQSLSSFGFNNKPETSNTTQPVINFPMNPQISKTYEDMEDDEQPITSITSTPKAVRSKKPPNTVSYVKAGSKFDFKKKIDEEDLLDNDPLVLEEDKFALNRPLQPKPSQVVDLNRTAPIQGSVPFNDSFESSTNGISPFAKYLEKNTNHNETIFSISNSPLNTKSPPTQSIYQKSILSNTSAMEEDNDSYNPEYFEFTPNTNSSLSKEDLWWKILHESAEMFLYMQDAFLEDKLDKNILEKTISQFKSIIYQGIGELRQFGAYFDIFSAIDIFYFNRFCRGGLLQKLVKWYIRSSVCFSRESELDQNLYRLLVIGEHSAKVIEAIKQQKSAELKTMPRKLHDLYTAFFEILSKRPNVVNYSSISATFEEYLDEMQVWKRLVLKVKKELQGQDDGSDDFAFLNTCVEIVTGNENTITDVSENWIEILIGLALYKYQHFADINEIIDLAIHAKNLKIEETEVFVLEAIGLFVFGDNLEDTLRNIDQGLALSNQNQENFRYHWFMSHVATFLYHINFLYQRIYTATNANSYIESLHTFKNEAIKSYVIEELLPYYQNLIDSNPCENLENDLWKIAIDYLSYYDDESQKQVQGIINNIIENIHITNENQIDKIYRYVKDTPFAKTVCSKLHLKLGLDYITENNFAAGIYHVYKSGNMDELEDVIRDKISTTQNLRYVHYGLEEYSFMIEMPEIQWISSFFKILDNCAVNAHLLPSTLSEIPNSELKLELLMSINLTLLQYTELLSVMEHVEYMEFEFKENLSNNDLQTKLLTLSELRLLLAQTLQIKILQ